MGYLYGLKNKINGKSYIGQTIRSIQKRLKEHQDSKSNRGIAGAIKKYGLQNFDIYYCECPDEDLNKYEKLMVEVLGTLSPGGYNLMEGGGSCGKTCEESKQLIKESNSGDKNPMYGTTGEKSHRSKRVYQYDLDGNFIDSFGSCREAARYLKKDNTCIGKCALGKYKTAYNYKWSYNLNIFM